MWDEPPTNIKEPAKPLVIHLKAEPAPITLSSSVPKKPISSKDQELFKKTIPVALKKVADGQGNMAAAETVRAVANESITVPNPASLPPVSSTYTEEAQRQAARLLVEAERVKQRMTVRVEKYLSDTKNMELMYWLQTMLLLLKVDPETGDFLEEHGLKVGKDRGIPETCKPFQELPDAPGYLRYNNLTEFIGKNPHHELGIYKKTINGKPTCFFINDLYHHVHRPDGTVPDPFKNDYEEISDWYHAYERYLLIINSHPENLPQIQRISRLLAPEKPKPVTFWGSLKRKLSSMFYIIAWKLAFDVAYALWCFWIKGMVYYQCWEMGFLGDLAWNVASDLLVGDLLSNVFSLLKQLLGFEEPSQEGILGYVEWLFTGIFSFIPAGQDIMNIFRAWGILAPQSRALLLAGLSGLTGAGALAIGGYISGASFMFLTGAAASSGPSLLAKSVELEMQSNTMRFLWKTLNPDRNRGLSWLLTLLVPTKLCTIIPWAVLRQACQMFTRTSAAIVAWLGPARVVIDMLVDVGWIPIDHALSFGETRCMKLFNRTTGSAATLKAYNQMEAHRQPHEAVGNWYTKNKNELSSKKDYKEEIFSWYPGNQWRRDTLIEDIAREIFGANFTNEEKELTGNYIYAREKQKIEYPKT